jgi:hypothetical protein
MPSGSASAPSADLGGGGGGGTGRRVTSAPLRTTWIGWFEAKVGPQRAITPADGASAPELTPLEHVKACLRMDEALAEGDKRPTLVYFHWPHEHAQHGEATLQLCTRVFDEETTARWGTLFRCVQVDMAASDARLVELLGRVTRPSVLVLDAEAKEVARIEGVTTAGKMHKALKDAYQRFPEAWKRVQREIEDQRESLETARKLAKEDDLDGALVLVDRVRMSAVRVGEPFDQAQVLGRDLQLKKEQAAARERRK